MGITYLRSLESGYHNVLQIVRGGSAQQRISLLVASLACLISLPFLKRLIVNGRFDKTVPIIKLTPTIVEQCPLGPKRDILMLWEKLASEIRSPAFFQMNSKVSLSDQFSAWVSDHRWSLQTIQKLELINKQLTTLPPQIGQLSYLTKLYLWNNQLTALPVEIGQLSQLTDLGAQFNQLQAIPAEIGRLKNLFTLCIHMNNLQSLPPEIGQCTNLRRLAINDNHIIHVPSEIAQCTNLLRLNADRNRWTFFPPSLLQLPLACSISVRKNLFTPHYAVTFLAEAGYRQIDMEVDMRETFTRSSSRS